MYIVDVALCGGADSVVTHTDRVSFYSKWVARKWAREVIKCKDVANVMVIDSETGEIMLELNEDGSVEIDSEG